MCQVYAALRGKDPYQGPRGFELALWTRWMVRDLIARMFAVELTEQSVGRVLRRLGLSPQRVEHDRIGRSGITQSQ